MIVYMNMFWVLYDSFCARNTENCFIIALDQTLNVAFFILNKIAYDNTLLPVGILIHSWSVFLGKLFC